MKRIKKAARKIRTVCFLIVFMLLVSANNAFAGWQSSGGRWWYQNDDGSYLNGALYGIDGTMYAFDENGYMLENQWVELTDGNWVYCMNGGAIAKNQWIDGQYYVGSDGLMLKDTHTPDGYYVGSDGKWISGMSSSGNSSGTQAASSNTYGMWGTYDGEDYIQYEIKGRYASTSNWYIFNTVGLTNHGITKTTEIRFDPSILQAGMTITKEAGEREKKDEWLFNISPLGSAYSTDNKFSEYVLDISGFDGTHVTGRIYGVMADSSSSEKRAKTKDFDFEFRFTTNVDEMTSEGNLTASNRYKAERSGYSSDSSSYSSSYSGSSSTSGSSSANDHTCRTCHGSGICNRCAGRGEKRNSSNGKYYDCISCQGSGQCAICHGTGKVY